MDVFNTLIVEMHISGKQKHDGLSIPDWEDERGRLRMWAANIGAHQTGQSSLDFRLRDSSQIQQQIIRLLENIARLLQDARTVMTEGEDSDLESINGSDSENEEPQSELQQLRSNVASLITCLFEISVLIRKPARHDVGIRSKDTDLAAYEWADRRHVQDKFPNADDKIVSRLAYAITYRRKYLRYRERHAAKLRQGIDHDAEGEQRDGQSEMLSATIATEVKPNGGDDVVDNASDSGFTRTSYASTLISGSRLTIPTAPEASRGGAPFECPYCYCIVTAPSSASWSRHVFNDLQPYVCTVMECKTPTRLYTTKHEWLHHIKSTHRLHGHETRVCALCGDDQASLGRHVARHLQELALFVLPRNYADSDEDVSDAKADTSSNPSSLDNGQGLFSAIAPKELLNDVKRYTCTVYEPGRGSARICGKLFRREADLNIHVSTFHSQKIDLERMDSAAAAASRDRDEPDNDKQTWKIDDEGLESGIASRRREPTFMQKLAARKQRRLDREKRPETYEVWSTMNEEIDAEGSEEDLETMKPQLGRSRATNLRKFKQFRRHTSTDENRRALAAQAISPANIRRRDSNDKRSARESIFLLANHGVEPEPTLIPTVLRTTTLLAGDSSISGLVAPRSKRPLRRKGTESTRPASQGSFRLKADKRTGRCADDGMKKRRPGDGRRTYLVSHRKHFARKALLTTLDRYNI
ncbi:MAG: hypothetical protein Q9196_004869 [Gyalolechia fulgens]